MKNQNRKTKRIYALISSIVMIGALNLGGITANALDTSNIINFGNGIIDALRSISVIVCIGAVIVLGIMLITAGRGWSEKLKTGAAGIILGIILISGAGAIIPSLFADAGGTGGNGAAQVRYVDMMD